MDTFEATFNNHQISTLQRSLIRPLLLRKFATFISNDALTDFDYSLRIFLQNENLKYLNQDLAEQLLNLFETDAAATLRAFDSLSNGISHAGFSLLREAQGEFSEKQISIDSPDDISKFETLWHPEYQRISEHVFNHFINIPLLIKGIERGKDYISMTLSNRAKMVQELISNDFCKGFSSVVRNGISHGSVEFLSKSILYSDKKEKIEIYPSEFASKLDSMTDECSSYLFALTVFCTRQCTKDPSILPKIPLIIKYLMVSGFTNNPRVTIRHFFESQTIKNDHQLNIQCSIKSKTRMVHLFESLYISYIIQKWFRACYSRIAISIDCGGPINASLFINGKALQNSIENDKSMDESKDVLETNMLWYDNSSIFRKLYFWLCYFPIQKELVLHEIYKTWEDMGTFAVKDRYVLKDIENRSAGNISRSVGIITLSDGYHYTTASMVKVIAHAIKLLRKHRVHYVFIPKRSLLKHKPAHVWLKVYISNQRLRSLKPIENIKSDELVSKAEWIRKSKNISPLFVKNPDILEKGIRICFNEKYVTRIAPDEAT